MAAAKRQKLDKEKAKTFTTEDAEDRRGHGELRRKAREENGDYLRKAERGMRRWLAREPVVEMG